MPNSGSTDRAVVGIDDTDTPDEGGTGCLARRLVGEVEALGLGVSLGVTRHQFYQGPEVPKTARNSAAAIIFREPADPDALFEAVTTIVSRESIRGSNPGVAMLTRKPPRPAVLFARLAQQTIVTQEQTVTLAAAVEVTLAGLGGTESGIIGAFGAAVLRGDGRDGRFVGLRGIRDVSGEITVADLIAATDIAAVVNVDGWEPLEAETSLDIGDWVRPRLIGGRPVIVAREEKGSWVNADTRRR